MLAPYFAEAVADGAAAASSLGAAGGTVVAGGVVVLGEGTVVDGAVDGVVDGVVDVVPNATHMVLARAAAATATRIAAIHPPGC